MANYRECSFYCSAVEIYRLFSDIKDTTFLDSSLANKYGNYSIIGINPYLKVEDRNGQLYVNGTEKEGTLLDFISDHLERHADENQTTLPLLSGAIGYLTYDFGMELNGLSSRHPREVDIPDGSFIFYENFIIEDKNARKIYLTADENLKDWNEKLTALEKDLEKRMLTEKPMLCRAESKCKQPVIHSNFKKEEYLEAIDKVVKHIVDGDIYITNLTRQITVEAQISPFEVFLRLRRISPSPFGGFLNFGDFKVICSSPERFIKLVDGIVETRPVKGTRKRGETFDEDQALRTDLLHSGKDKSELLMITDLERNDLNKVCEPGSVEVTELFKIETYSTVFHLVSTVIGKIKEDMGSMALMSAVFPGGSITGAPKRRAMEIIDETEHSRRGLYTGSIGFLSFANSCDFNIVIRTAIYKDERFHIGVGGGITCESDLEFEFEETEQKAKALLEAMK